jgi:UDP-glucose 4-epimerase
LLRQMIDALEIALHRKAAISRRSARRGDVAQTFANIERAHSDLLYNPKVSLQMACNASLFGCRDETRKWFRCTPSFSMAGSALFARLI